MTIKHVQYDKETDEYFIEFTEEEMDQIGWCVGDTLRWEDNGENIVLSKVYVEETPEMLKDF